MHQNYKIRPARIPDTEGIFKIIKHFALQEHVLERPIDEITAHVDHFLIAETENRIIATISYHDYGSGLKEIRSLGVYTEHQGKRIATALLNTLIMQIQKMGESQIFTLTEAVTFFEKNNFVEISRDNLPEKIWKDCSTCTHIDRCNETAMIYQGPHNQQLTSR